MNKILLTGLVLALSGTTFAFAEDTDPTSDSDKISATINAVNEQVQRREAALSNLGSNLASTDVSPETKEYLRKLEIQSKKPDPKIGMTKKEVIKNTNWGEPESVNTTETARTIYEQWVYGQNQYLYFRNGRLSTIQY